MELSEYILKELKKPLLDGEKKPVVDASGKPLTKEEAIAINVVNNAMQGDIAAIKFLQQEARKSWVEEKFNNNSSKLCFQRSKN